MSTSIADYCIHPHNITLGPRKVAAAVELTRDMAHDTVYAMAVSPTSAKASLSSIFCDDEASRQAPRSRSKASHGRVRMNSIASSTSSTLDSPLKTPNLSENALVEFENRSKFFEQMLVCSFCSKQGPNFPKCGKCDKAWCSRDCRLRGSMQHTCAQKRPKGRNPVLSIRMMLTFMS